MIVAVTVFVTGEVAIVKVAVVAPAGTTTVAGVTAFELFEDRATVVPFAGAAPLSVTVPVADMPPITVFGEMLTDVTVAGFTVREADFATPP